MPILYDPYTKGAVHSDSLIEPKVTSDADGDFIVHRERGKTTYKALPTYPTVPVAENVPTITSDVSTVAGLRGEVNKILDALKDAGMMEEDPEEEEEPADT